ncbi:methyl-accepting chemotaxis protein [Evansella vedderi]|uniref:Methyl-accepting chemotaxis protein n=1 Tax=Evansella vedderi TaxID=38282 RepID=A0ABT9ZRH4_9BACI|nr:HAMP domain-containing protein [Evansella vedderi]MDQ0253058.1 methyl-accepting chemotaxis protein [Evansella vedderi]
MKKNTIMLQLVVKISLVLGFIAIIVLLLGYQIIKVYIEENQLEQINSATSTVVHAMSSTQKSAETLENMIEHRLYTSSKGIMSDLRGKSVLEISQEMLSDLAEKWDVHEISLWERQGDDIVVTQSSDVTQLNLSSKDWGYWFTAFNQLMNQEVVIVDEGFTLENYWVGPISRADRFDNIYYKFAYYYDGTADFMINPYILDEEIYKHTFEAGPTQMIDRIVNENLDMKEIAVINVDAWLQGEDHEVIEPDIDLPILYGSHQFSLEEDTDLIPMVKDKGETQSILFDQAGTSYKKIYTALPNNRVMTIVLDLSRQKQMESHFLLLFILLFIVSSIVLFLMIHFIAKRQLKPLNDIVDHIEDVADGDLTQTITLNERNELDKLSTSINDMTKRFQQLITGVKGETHSLMIVSNLLSKQVYDSVKTMENTSTMMTSESKEIVLEISIFQEELEKLLEALENECLSVEEEQGANGGRYLPVKTSLSSTHGKIMELEKMIKNHSNHVTEITIMFYDTLNELKTASHKIDQLSMELNQKIEYFKVREE